MKFFAKIKLFVESFDGKLVDFLPYFFRLNSSYRSVYKST